VSRGGRRLASRCGRWLLLAALQAGAATAAERRALDVEVSFWAFPNRPVAISVQQQGVLAGRRVAVYLFVDENQVGRIHTTGDRTRVSVDMPPLAPGRHRLLAKVGTESVETEFRVLSWFTVGIPALAVLAAIAYGLARARRRQKPTSS
jgi:hypothetical protein